VADEEQERPAWPQMVTAAMYLAYLAGAVWMSLPAHRRAEIRMKTAARVRAVAAAGARRAGEASMGHELRTGRRLYGLPYLLSVARDRAARAYDRARSA
jgi:hypothetical protein